MSDTIERGVQEENAAPHGQSSKTHHVEHVDKAIQAANAKPSPKPRKAKKGGKAFATIPPPPPEHETSGRYWHWGFPMTTTEVEEFLLLNDPDALVDDPDSPDNWLIDVAAAAGFYSGWAGVHFVMVQRAEDMPVEEWKTAYEMDPPSDDHVSFFMVKTTSNPHLKLYKPEKRQLEKLKRMFRKEPVWMMDAFSKEEFDKMFLFDY